MIIRNGFVSNSSSSNFIIGFDREPDAEYLKTTIFNDEKSVIYVHGTELIRTDDLVDELVHQLSGQIPMTLDQIAHQMEHGYYDERLNELTSWWPEYPSHVVSQTEYDRIEKENIHNRLANAIETRRLSRKLASGFLDENPNKVFFLFKFYDDNRIGSHLEYGEVFSGVPFLRISHH